MLMARRFLLGGKSPIPAALRNSLIGYWKLDEASGNRADSFSSNTLVDFNTVTGNPGPSGKISLASQFTRANSEALTLADNTGMSMGAGLRMSACAWAYMDSEPAAGMCVLSKWQGVGAREWVLYRNNANDRFDFIVSSDGSNVSATATANTFGAITTATWYFICVRYDGANIYVSVNGGAEDSTAFSADIFNGNDSFTIGTNQATNFWDGRIAGVGFWKRSLTAAERTWLYNNGAGRLYPFAK